MTDDFTPNPEAVRRIERHLLGEDMRNVAAVIESSPAGWTMAPKAEASRPPVSGDALREALDRWYDQEHPGLDENEWRDGLAAYLSDVIALAATPPERSGLTFAEFARVNRARCEAEDGFGHPLSGWSVSDWFLAAMGEFGEAANKAKKLNRVRDGIPGNSEAPEELRAGLADEIADAVIYLDLLAQSEGFDLGSVVASKFNRTSEKIGSPARLSSGGEDTP